MKKKTIMVKIIDEGTTHIISSNNSRHNDSVGI